SDRGRRPGASADRPAGGFELLAGRADRVAGRVAARDPLLPAQGDDGLARHVRPGDGVLLGVMGEPVVVAVVAYLALGRLRGRERLGLGHAEQRSELLTSR